MYANNTQISGLDPIVGVPMFTHIAGMIVVLSLLVASGCQAVTPDILQRLPEQQARELSVYSSQHANLFDLRIHSMDTCPFLTYMPHAMFSNHDTVEYATWLHDFYMHKHEEEQSIWGCTCDQQLSNPVDAGPSTRK